MFHKGVYYKKIKGSKPTLVFIHGLAGTSESWSKQARALKGSEILLIDLRGHGKSIKSNATLKRMIKDVKEIISKETKDYLLIGFSLGGYIALQIKGPKILINPLINGSSLKKSFIIKAWIARFIPEWLLRILAKSNDLSVHEGLISDYAKMLLRTPKSVYWKLIKELRQVRTTAKGMIITSSSDEILSNEASDYVIKGHHHVMNENPRELNKLLKTLIKRVRPDIRARWNVTTNS